MIILKGPRSNKVTIPGGGGRLPGTFLLGFWAAAPDQSQSLVLAREVKPDEFELEYPIPIPTQSGGDPLPSIQLVQDTGLQLALDTDPTAERSLLGSYKLHDPKLGSFIMIQDLVIPPNKGLIGEALSYKLGQSMLLNLFAFNSDAIVRKCDGNALGYEAELDIGGAGDGDVWYRIIRRPPFAPIHEHKAGNVGSITPAEASIQANRTPSPDHFPDIIVVPSEGSSNTLRAGKLCPTSSTDWSLS